MTKSSQLMVRLDEDSKSFYQDWDFQELPGLPYRLFVTYQQLEAMMKKPS
jgi:hypothetical protein